MSRPSLRTKMALIVNPASGTVPKRKLVPRIVSKLAKSGIDLDVHYTKRQGHATEMARKFSKDNKYSAVVVCGGDGTVNETARGLIGTAMPMGIIPAGSGNGLARHLGIPVDIDRSLRVIAERNTLEIDYGSANGSPFFCTFGVGFDAAVSERFARSKRRGLITYLSSALDEFVRFSPEEYEIEANGNTIADKAFLVVVCNASQYGNNAFIAPTASVTDGELDVTIVYTGNLIQTAKLGVDFLTGYIGKNALINTFRAKEIKIRRKTAGVGHLDGDPSEMPQTIEVSCHPAGLTVLAPTRQTRFKPIITPISVFCRDIMLGAWRLLPWR